MSEPLKWKVSKPTVLLYDLKPISLSCHERALWSSSASFPQSLLTTQQLFLCFALQKQTYFLIKKGWEEEGFFYQNSFWSLNFTVKGWFTCSWVRVLPQDWCHPPRWFRPPTMWVSLRKSFSFPVDYRGSHQQPGSWSRWLSDCRNPKRAELQPEGY